MLTVQNIGAGELGPWRLVGDDNNVYISAVDTYDICFDTPYGRTENGVFSIPLAG